MISKFKKRNLTVKYCLAAFFIFPAYSCFSDTVLSPIDTPTTPSPIAISSVTISPDPSPSTDHSTMITLFNQGPSLPQWQLGFCFMQIPLVQLLPGTNPNLIMKICDANNNCSPLHYEKNTDITQSDLSAAYTSILSSSMPLLHGQTYSIQLLHTGLGAPNNYANVPQNFFLINPQTHQLSHISTQPSTYHLTSYNQGIINQTISQHIQNNWESSIPTDSKNNFSQIVPAPVNMTISSKTSQVFLLNTPISIHDRLTGNISPVSKMMASNLTHDLGLAVVIDQNSSRNDGIIIQKITDPALVNHNSEGYQIQIKSKSIVISALNDTGEFYALQTLRQLWNQDAQLNQGNITDYPRFQYRGVMLDVARHAFAPWEIEGLIDLMAAQKLNTLHIHFSDDEGFRIELPGTHTGLIGGTRGYGQLIAPLVFSQGNLDITNYKNQPYPYADTLYSHYYTTSDIQTLINYANARKITIIPEIDIPGHARALIKALPDSMIDPNDHSQFVSIQGYTDDVLPVCTYNPTNAAAGISQRFTTQINQIIQQIGQIFSHQNTLYAKNNEVSVGADEVNANAWSNDPECQGDWANLSALEKAQKFLQSLAASNANIIFSGWQQLVQTDGNALGNQVIPASQAGHIWVWNTSTAGIAQAISLADNQYPTVLALSDETYMDLTYTPDIHEPGFTWATDFADTQAALSSAASASQALQGLSPAEQNNILGIEGTLWSENLTTYNHLIYMALPKMTGLSEASWAPASMTVLSQGTTNKIDWKSLATRLGCGETGFLTYIHQLYGVYYRGYPNGISLETPRGTCPINSTIKYA